MTERSSARSSSQHKSKAPLLRAAQNCVYFGASGSYLLG